MTHGFRLGEKQFKFLHYSSSQMKAHACWFINETETLTYSNLMQSLGSFDHEKKISKNAARKGQAFSSALNVATLDIATEVEEIEDIRSSANRDALAKVFKSIPSDSDLHNDQFAGPLEPHTNLGDYVFTDG